MYHPQCVPANAVWPQPDPEVDRLKAELTRLRSDLEKAIEALEHIKQWSEAYPLAVFQEPDFAKAREVLEANGMTLDAISASNMRHVLSRIGPLVSHVLSQLENSKPPPATIGHLDNGKTALAGCPRCGHRHPPDGLCLV
jgi:hypothetical protein